MKTTRKRLMHPGYAAALRKVMDYQRVNGFATHWDLMAAMGMGRTGASLMLQWMAYFGILRRVEGQKATRKDGARIPVRAYTFAPLVEPGENPKPRGRMPLELMTFSKALSALQRDAWHGKGLAEETGMYPAQARALIGALHSLRMIYIDDYQTRANGGAGAPLYAWGCDHKDAIKPTPTPRRELWARKNAERSAIRRAARALGMSRAKRVHTLNVGIAA